MKSSSGFVYLLLHFGPILYGISYCSARTNKVFITNDAHVRSFMNFMEEPSDQIMQLNVY